MTIQQQVLNNYQLLFDEVNALETTVFTSFSEDEESAKKKFEECLFWFYVDGFSSGILQLDEDKDLPNGYEFLDITYPDGESVTQKFDKYYKAKDSKSIAKLLESEAGRMYNAGSLSAVFNPEDVKNGNYANSETKSGVMKTWCAILDNKTRDSHELLDGTKIPVEDYFVSVSGDEAMAPCHFSTAEENANCRCCLLYDR